MTSDTSLVTMNFAMIYLTCIFPAFPSAVWKGAYSATGKIIKTQRSEPDSRWWRHTETANIQPTSLSCRSHTVTHKSSLPWGFRAESHFIPSWAFSQIRSYPGCRGQFCPSKHLAECAKGSNGPTRESPKQWKAKIWKHTSFSQLVQGEGCSSC